MNRFLPSCLIALITLFGSNSALAVDQSPTKVRVQVVLRDTTDPLRVYYATKGSIAGGMLIPFFGIGNAIKADARGDQLTQAVGNFARGQALSDSFKHVLPAKYPVFEMEALEEGIAHASDSDLVKHARDAGFRYVLLVDEDFTGLTSGSVAAENDQVSVLFNAKIELFDAANGKRMVKTRVTASSPARESLATALASGDFFRTNFPTVADAFAVLVVGQLLRSDHLHTMATSIGQGDQVPAVSGVLASHADPIRISTKVPSGWHVVLLDTPYAKVIEPKSELKYKLGMRFDVDLLLSEFGQDVATVDAYMVASGNRFAEAGLDPATMAPYQGDALPALSGYTAYSIRRQNGTGGQLMFVKLLEKPYLAMITVVATEDLDGLVTANRTDIESVLHESDISIDQSKSLNKN